MAGVVVEEPAQLPLRVPCTRVSSRSANSRRRRPMSDRSWKERSGGGAVPARSPRPPGPPRGTSGRRRRGPWPGEPAHTVAPGAGPSAVRLSRSTVCRQGLDGRSASRTPSREGTEEADERRGPRGAQFLGEADLDPGGVRCRRDVHECGDEAGVLGGQPQRRDPGTRVRGERWRCSTRSRRALRCAVRSPGRGMGETGDGEGHRGPLQHGDVLGPEDRGRGRVVRAGGAWPPVPSPRPGTPPGPRASPRGRADRCGRRAGWPGNAVPSR